MNSRETATLVDGHAGAVSVTLGETVIGQTASQSCRFTAMEAALCGILADDVIQLDRGTTAGNRSAGVQSVSDPWLHALVCSVLATILPGGGRLCRTLHLDIERTVRLEEVITATVTVVDRTSRGISLACACTDGDGTVVASGSVEVTISVERGGQVPSEASRRRSYQALRAKCAGLPPLRIAVVDPCDADTLTSTVTAAEAGLIEPVLIGPAARICSVAALCHLDIRPFHLIGVDHEAAAEVASALAHTGKVEAIMVGGVDDGDAANALMKTQPRSPDSLRVLGLEATILQGAEVPILLTGNADDMDARLACCAIVSQLAASRCGRLLGAE
ncbi:enoyl-CoA hydratase [Azospirillum sp. TSH100]|uniref:enoyl-CoA hydratase n=1 Tax=Azospirillum sp. TSH100 TaxID=652764 RepID=UPI000D6472FE|nr:enoyl-CoA hydratase [Azospirillum sp. TSH100]QCG89104.1 enoyl-CoA hydratase [Azospirillum sp. TSH100]